MDSGLHEKSGLFFHPAMPEAVHFLYHTPLIQIPESDLADNFLQDPHNL